MKAKNCLIFGGSGQIGRNLIRKLTKNNYRVTVVTRNIHQKSYIIKTQANAGYLDIVEANIYDEKKIRELFKKVDICINLVGILFEQASSRALTTESNQGKLTYAFSVRNQFMTTLGTLDGLVSLRSEFLEYHRDFYATSKDVATKNKIKGY